MSKIMNKMYFKGLSLVSKAKTALKNERGDTNIIAIIIILAIVIALAIVFRSQLKNLFDQIWNGIFGTVSKSTTTY